MSESWAQSSLAVVAESASRVLVLPSMKVMGSISGFLDLVACAAIRLASSITKTKYLT